MTFEVTLVDTTVERVDGADSFQQEGPLTTFFGTDGRRRSLDCWSTKVASYRTERIVKIRRLGHGGTGHDDRAPTVSGAAQGEDDRAPGPEVGTFANTL
jgi:hypothetical protein